MASIGIGIGPLSDTEHRVQLRRALVASTVGTTIEWYDFLPYGQVTGLVFGKLFFPQSDPIVGVLQAFAVFFVGFLGRPIGAAIFGHWGDRIGAQGYPDRDIARDWHCDGSRRSRADLREHRYLGGCPLDDHPPDPGDRRRRRVGRFGAAGDGMGAQ